MGPQQRGNRVGKNLKIIDRRRLAVALLNEPPGLGNRCNDFDEDCPGNGGALVCWLYAPEEGYCPLLLDGPT